MGQNKICVPVIGEIRVQNVEDINGKGCKEYKRLNSRAQGVKVLLIIRQGKGSGSY